MHASVGDKFTVLLFDAARSRRYVSTTRGLGRACARVIRAIMNAQLVIQEMQSNHHMQVVHDKRRMNTSYVMIHLIVYVRSMNSPGSGQPSPGLPSSQVHAWSICRTNKT